MHLSKKYSASDNAGQTAYGALPTISDLLWKLIGELSRRVALLNQTEDLSLPAFVFPPTVARFLL